jgi:hypothetical protein
MLISFLVSLVHIANIRNLAQIDSILTRLADISFKYILVYFYVVMIEAILFVIGFSWSTALGEIRIFIIDEYSRIISFYLVSVYLGYALTIVFMPIESYLHRCDKRGKISTKPSLLLDNDGLGDQEIAVRQGKFDFVSSSILGFVRITVLCSFLTVIGYFLWSFIDTQQIAEPRQLLGVFLNLGLPLGLLVGFRFALMPLVRYFSLWIILWQNGKIYYRIDYFLDYMVERKIMQNINGNYRFVHQLLQENFDQL